MLDAYAQSLKHLKSEDEYVRIILKILAKLIRDHAVVERQPPDSSTRLLNFHYDLNVTGNYLSSILATSESFNVEQSAPLNDYFDSIQLAKHIYHSSDHDGFGLYLSLRSLLPEEFPAQSVRIKIVSTGSGQRSELWLNADDTQLIRPGRTRIALVSKVQLHEI